MAASTTAAVAAVTAVAATAYGAYNEYQNAKAQESVNNLNASLVEADIRNVRNEQAINMGRLRMSGRQQIESAKNAMAAVGNIGSSADAAVNTAYNNLAGDLTTMSFNYETQVQSLRGQKANYLMNADIARSNKTSAIIGGVFNTAAVGAKGASSYISAGGTFRRSGTKE